MLSYIHAYHAGNHADILKHLTLSLILEHLCQKEKPFTVIETHAGSGLYRLDDDRAVKTNEANSGIGKLMRNAEFSNLCQSVKSADIFFKLISDYFVRGEYPGSPLIENEFLRKGDEQILSELHPTAFEELKTCFYNRQKECAKTGGIFVQPHIHNRDGYELLNAITPPKIKRGLCVIDPSFEDASDFEKCAELISRIHKKWNSGIIALWYPLVAHRSQAISMMKERIASGIEGEEPAILDIQMEIKRKEEMTGLSSLYGSGMFIVNFPYKLDEKMNEIMPALSKLLGETSQEWSVTTR